ncbi:MAG: reverse transcriptase family protein [Candidatus Thiodiazotropha sp. (ex Monitilora ramsayi)]|nr:reverse transcriptase family protein [Candidatus Thiodiazotropha sp. (ex Monitilora ramsayi)]
MGNGLSSFTTNLRLLAVSVLAGAWDKPSLIERLERALDGGPPDPRRLAARLLFHFETEQPPTRRQLLAFFANEQALQQRFANPGAAPPKLVLDPPRMGRPPEKLVTLPLPPLSTRKDLTEWLGLFDHELAWFADMERRQCHVTQTRLHHYRYRWIEKPSGDLRLIEIPKPRMKSIQRRILRDILNRLPPHPSAHGFCRGRSSKSFVEGHLHKPVLLRMDLKDFFHSVPVARIGALFRRVGYPTNVARLLQGLCTHSTSEALAGAEFISLPWERRKRLADKHLPQGAPSSPALANLCAWRFDCRLQGIAERFNLDYTRYADDIAFSGGRDLLRLAPFLQGLIGAIAIEEGFEINHRKTRIRTEAQSQRLAGMVVNHTSNLPRAEFDRIKAILHNCIHQGPRSQNRQGHADFKAHLAGRIAYVKWLNPTKGERLQGLWNRVVWDKDR